MANIVRIESIGHPGLEPYFRLTDRQLRNELNPQYGMIIVESPKVIRVAIVRGYEPVSLLCEEKHITGDAADIIEKLECPVFTGSRGILEHITGYTLTRGVLCAMRRPTLPAAAELCRNAKRVAVIDGVTDTTNIGAIFRSAAALGIDAVLLTPTSCDPFNRRSIRVSMGSVFLVPWAWLDTPIKKLSDSGFTTVALALKDDSYSLDDPRLSELERIAFVLGTEGDGLSEEVIGQTDLTVKIPMAHGVDSLNVAAAAAVAFWQLRVR